VLKTSVGPNIPCGKRKTIIKRQTKNKTKLAISKE
jgi:hypothetical protein